MQSPTEKPKTDFDQRIEAMYRRDWCGAWLLVALLWVTIIFVLYMAWPHIPDRNIRIVLLLGATAVLIFNTASIYAMATHYADDKHFIYGLDLQHLDAARKNRNEGRH